MVVCTCNPFNPGAEDGGRTSKVNLAHKTRPITEEKKKKQTNIYFWSMVGINLKKNPQGINIPLSELALPGFPQPAGQEGTV